MHKSPNIIEIILQHRDILPTNSLNLFYTPMYLLKWTQPIVGREEMKKPYRPLKNAPERHTQSNLANDLQVLCAPSVHQGPPSFVRTLCPPVRFLRWYVARS